MSYRKMRDRFLEGLENFFKKHAIDYGTFSTDTDFYPPLHHLLRTRSRRVS